MADKGSIAPKERVNIVFKPTNGAGTEDVELPFKILMLGDYTGRSDNTPLEERQAVNINKENFHDVMRSHQLGLDLAVRNTLSGVDGDELNVNLRFDGLRDFEPDSLVNQVPELSQLLELRSALTALKGPLGNVPAFRRKLEAIVQDDDTRIRLLEELSVAE